MTMLSIKQLSAGIFIGSLAITNPSLADDTQDNTYPHIDAEAAHCSVPTAEQSSILRSFCYPFEGLKRAFDRNTQICDLKADGDGIALQQCLETRDQKYLDSANAHVRRADHTIKRIEKEKGINNDPPKETRCFGLKCYEAS